ncbi:hypothetical protein [Amycolatopsis sp. NPDC059021]|uniref:hypothetical protein n=1 Tax=Amycolatopsis sp. NPDC059021 TaxID=3346704 RepID=UPI0036706C43
MATGPNITDHRATPRMTARGQLYASVEAYNSAHPDAALPLEMAQRHRLRCYTAAHRGLIDDVTGTDFTWTIAFLPDLPTDRDRPGVVLATRWGAPPLLVLAQDVGLRTAWTTLVERWPTHLSEAATLLDSLARVPASTDSSV